MGKSWDHVDEVLRQAKIAAGKRMLEADRQGELVKFLKSWEKPNGQSGTPRKRKRSRT